MPEALIEDDPDDHVAFDGRRIAKARAACVLHLADLKQFELWPDRIRNEDVDAGPRSGGRPACASCRVRPAPCALTWPRQPSRA